MKNYAKIKIILEEKNNTITFFAEGFESKSFLLFGSNETAGRMCLQANLDCILSYLQKYKGCKSNIEITVLDYNFPNMENERKKIDNALKQIADKTPKGFSNIYKVVRKSRLPLTMGIVEEPSHREVSEKSSSNSLPSTKTNSISMRNISMMVLGGFIAVVGVTTLAIAFALLNAASFGGAGLVVSGIGCAAALSGAGLFAKGLYKNMNFTDNRSIDLSSCHARL